MKISISALINTCYGGFSLSDEFLIKIFITYGQSDGIFTRRQVSENYRRYDPENVIDLPEYGIKVRRNNYGEVYNYAKGEICTINTDVARFHKGVHEIYLSLGGSEYCSGFCAELELVDIEYEVEVTSFEGIEEVVVNKIR